MNTHTAHDGPAYRYVSEYTRSGKLRRRRVPVLTTPDVPSSCVHCQPSAPISAPVSTAGPVLLDGLPIDPLAFDADPGAFLRAVFGPTFGEVR
jgi:hypothetical protein